MRTQILNHFHTFHPEAQAEFDTLAREEKRITLALARRGSDNVEGPAKPRRMSEPPEDLDAQLADVRAKMDVHRATIASGIVRVHIKGLTRSEFRRLYSVHPPRDDEAYDAEVGYNVDTFGDALVKACIVRTENLDGETVPNEWDTWADEMTNGQWEEFFRACLKITNDGEPSNFPR